MGSQSLAVGNQKQSVGGVDALGEHHAGAKFGEQYFTLLAGHHRLGQGTEESPDRLRVEVRAAAAADFVRRRLAGQTALRISHGDTQQPRQPRDILALEAVGISGSVKSFMVGANGGRNRPAD